MDYPGSLHAGNYFIQAKECGEMWRNVSRTDAILEALDDNFDAWPPLFLLLIPTFLPVLFT
jgi:hypothetical protein